MDKDTQKALNLTVSRRSTLTNILINVLSFLFAYKYIDMGLEPLVYEPIFGVLQFVIEILFVQMYFKGPDSKLVEVPYDQWMVRSKSFLNRNIIFKAFVVNIISQVVSINLNDYIVSVLRDMFHPLWKYTGLLTKLISGVAVGVLFVNMLKYRWAYIDVTESNLNAIILAWFSIVIMLHLLRAVIKKTCRHEPEKKPKQT